MQVTRTTLVESEALQIGLFEARNVSDKCGDVEQQSRNVVVLPFSGVFAKHEAPHRHVIGTPSHAVLIAADTSYRLGFPGAIGDRALILRFDDALAAGDLSGRGDDALASSGLLSAEAMMLRNLLCARFARSTVDEFEAESLGLDLLAMSLGTMRSRERPVRRGTQTRWARALERVKEAVAVAPADKWSVEKLAESARLSPYHVCRIFRRMTGSSIYEYVLSERLASTLDAVLDGDDLTRIALDCGFASHSHFTMRFREFFGCTPATLRRRLKSHKLAQMRKIVTAQRRAGALD
ncbi:MAG TPA: AraC family transcriptional regulator [Stellaceae bacterium]|nr:AraC family transcriptional regulator [Stellaceae bacterium]